MPVYASNSCILQKICNSAPWGHTFRWVWVAEFGATPVPGETFGTDGRISSGSGAVEYKLERRNSRIIQNEDGVGDGYLLFSDYQRNVEKEVNPDPTLGS
ncbi:unnamed protein product [Boreogadus saida]